MDKKQANLPLPPQALEISLNQGAYNERLPSTSSNGSGSQSKHKSFFKKGDPNKGFDSMTKVWFLKDTR